MAVTGLAFIHRDEAIAATSGGALAPSVTILSSCSVSTTTLDFGVVANVNVNRNNTGTITVNCSNGIAYAVGLGVGIYGGGTVTTRRMRKIVGGTQTIDYGIFRNNGRTQNWGQTVGTDTVAGTGNGAAQNITAFGRILGGQGAKPIGGYSDTVQVTVTY